MNGLDALVVSKARVGETHAGHGSAAAPADGEAGAAFHAVLRDVGHRKGEPHGALEKRGGDEPVTAGSGEAEGKAGDRDGREADAAAAMPLPSTADAARILAELTAARDVRPRPSNDGEADAGERGKSAAATAPGGDAAEQKPKVLKATVVARETHFEPVKRPDALDRMTAAAGSAADGDAATAPETAAEEPAAPRAVRTAGLAASGTLTTAQAGAETARWSQDPAGAVLATAQAAAEQGTRRTPAPATAPRSGGAEASEPSVAATKTDATHAADAAHAADAPLAAQARGDRAGEDRTTGGGTGSGEGDAPVAAAVEAAGAAAADGATETLEALPAPTLQRLAGSILTEARALASAAASAGTGGEPQQQSGGPVKILTIRLHPDELGTVTVRLRLVGNALEMQFRVSNADTAELLKRDRQALSELLKSSGYDADLLTIQTAGGDGGLRAVAVPDGSSASGSAQRQDWQQPDGFRQGGQPAGQQEGGERSRQHETPSRGTTERHDETLADSGRSGDLYV